jgi:outer membrane protein OmpA-like peptidoglycan-associated protein
MIWFNLFRRRGRATPASWIAAVVAGAALSAAGPAAAQETAANPNVIVDESALDAAEGGSIADTGLLTPPERPPVSRLVTTTGSESTSGLVFPPETTSDTTFSAVPTTPIESISLDGAEPTEDVMTAEPSAGTDLATAETPTEDSAEPAATEAATDETEAAAADQTEATADETEAGEQQTAARPPIDGMVRVPYDPESATIPEPAKSELNALAERLNADYLLRLQVLAYAAGDEDQSSHARGVSLARALAVRDYLSDQGIGMDRMDIRALGNTAQEEPADRVDLIPLAQ